MRHLFLLCATVCTLVSSFAQVENIKVVPAGDKINITYDLTSSDPSQKFKITAFSGHDNFVSPLQHVSGAVGENVTSGKGLRIEWDAKNSLPAGFNSNITIRIRAVAMPMLKPLEKTVYKKGSNIPITWTGGGKSDKMNIELVRNGEVEKVIGSGVENTHSITWKIPNGVKAEKDYVIRISNATDPMQPSVSSNFEVKPRIPLLVKIVVPVVVAGAIIWATTGDGGGGGGNGTDDVLPEITIKPN